MLQGKGLLRDVTLQPGATKRVPIERQYSNKEWNAQPMYVEHASSYKYLYKKYREDGNDKICPHVGCYNIKENG